MVISLMSMCFFLISFSTLFSLQTSSSLPTSRVFILSGRISLAFFSFSEVWVPVMLADHYDFHWPIYSFYSLNRVLCLFPNHWLIAFSSVRPHTYNAAKYNFTHYSLMLFLYCTHRLCYLLEYRSLTALYTYKTTLNGHLCNDVHLISM